MVRCWVVTFEQISRRIDLEIARTKRQPFSVAVLRLDEQHLSEAGTLAKGNPMDVFCHEGNVIALFPEVDAREGHSRAKAMLEAVTNSIGRGGVASYPANGRDPEALLAAARGSVAIAQPGQVVAACASPVVHTIASNRVMLADTSMINLYDLVRRLARSDLSVLVTGETGSGKENAAAALHQWSPRCNGPWVSLNCAALPDSLAESELFGYERGAFSDARVAKPGLLERAHQGTLFLDEVGDLSLAVQAKLLRAVEVKKISRLGDVREREIDVRIVAATNIDLAAAVAAQRFRQDLMFRLSAATIVVPPLRDRRKEIPLLARMFVEQCAHRLGRAGLQLSEVTVSRLMQHDFPGNVRELKNAIDYAVAVSEGTFVEPHDLPRAFRADAITTPIPLTGPRRFRPIIEELRELERQRIVEALDACDGVQTHAAAALAMPLRTFTFRMRQYGIEPSRERHR